MRPFTIDTADGATATKDNYNGRLIRGIADWSGLTSTSTLKPIWESPEFGTWTTHKGYLDMITYNFMWDPSNLQPTPGQTVGVASPAYILLFIVKLKDPNQATINNASAAQIPGNDDLDVTTIDHLLHTDGSIDPSKFQQDVHFSRGVGDSNVILSDKYFDVVAKWNVSYNMKSIQSLNLPGNALCTWEYKLPGGHRKLHRTQDYMNNKTGFAPLDSTAVSNLEVANPNMTGASTGANNLSWLRYEPRMCDWKDQYHIIGFTTVPGGVASGTLRCRMDYTFSTK